jgi:hypothetical protein
MQPEEQPVPLAQPVPSEPYDAPLPLYATRSEEERNYKDIIDKIYKNSIKQAYIPIQPQPQPVQQSVQQPVQQSVQQPVQSPVPEQPIYESEPEQPIERTEKQRTRYAEEQPIYAEEEPIETPTDSVKKIDFRDLKRQAEADGLRVWISGGAKKHSIPEDFFNKGASLLKASLFFFAVAIIECLFVILFKNDLFTDSNGMIAYIAAMLSVTVAVPAVCTILYLAKYAPCCRRLKKAIPIETGIVLFLILFILLVAVDLLIGIKMTDIPHLFVSLIIPGVYLLNIILFACVYYLFSKSKI